MDGNKQCKDISLVQDGMPTNAGDIDKMHTIIASRDQELSQAALRVILSKRAKLVWFSSHNWQLSIAYSSIITTCTLDGN